MASSDLLYPIFVLPWNLSYLHTNSFPIGGKLGQASCKLLLFLRNVSIAVSMQNLILIAVDRFGAVLFPLRSPLIRSKLCSFFILATWIVAVAVSSPYLFTVELVEHPEGTRCVIKWEKVFEESSSFASFILASYSLFVYIPVLLLVILYPRWTVRQQSATAGQKKQKRASNVHCYRNSVCALLVTLLYQLFNRMVSGQFHAFLV